MVRVAVLTALLQVLALLLGNRVGRVGGAHASSQCVQVGQANSNADAYYNYTDYHRSGPWTIGTRKFDVKYLFLDFAVDWKSVLDENVQDCPYKPQQLPGVSEKNIIGNLCPTEDEVQIRTYAVKQDGKVMNGWLHFEVELMDKSDDILAIYVQVRDEFFNAIGEFVTHPEEQCEPDDALVQPTEFQILPCSAVGFREAKISNAIFMAERDAYRNQTRGANIDDFIPKESIARGIHFTWRLSEYWCNRHLRFRPEAIIMTKKVLATYNMLTMLNLPGLKVYRKAAPYWLLPRWFGAADIKLPATTLLCNEKVIDYGGDGTLAKDKETGKLVAPWLREKGVKSQLANDYIPESQWYEEPTTNITTLKSCMFNTRIWPRLKNTTFPFVTNPRPTFSGRCPSQLSKDPSHAALQGCNLDARAEEFQDLIATHPNIATYSSYVDELTGNRTRYCSLQCRTPNAANDTDLDAIKNYTDHSGEGNFTEIVTFHSDSRRKSMFEKFWSGRKYHAVLCIVWTMFLTPLGIFCARYFKETCMSLSCSGAHLWFWVHIATTVFASMLFISSLSGIWKNLETWGRSTHSYSSAHRGIGYFSATLFFLMIVLGGFRPTERKKRLILMTAHSILGFSIYFFNLLAMILAGYIPASPSMGDCDLEGNSTKESGVLYVVVVWIVMDSVLHGVMTALQVMMDNQAGLRRPWYCPIVPIMPFNLADDFAGSKVRKITLLIYAATAFIMTFTAVGLVNNPELPEECWNRTGPTTCTEQFGCSGEARGYFAMVKAQTRNTSGHYVFEGGFW